jgi:hypothetical protein
LKTVFTSKTSHQDAAFKAKMAGYNVVGVAKHPNGTFVVFAEKNQTRRLW